MAVIEDNFSTLPLSLRYLLTLRRRGHEGMLDGQPIFNQHSSREKERERNSAPIYQHFTIHIVRDLHFNKYKYKYSTTLTYHHKARNILQNNLITYIEIINSSNRKHHEKQQILYSHRTGVGWQLRTQSGLLCKRTITKNTGSDRGVVCTTPNYCSYFPTPPASSNRIYHQAISYNVLPTTAMTMSNGSVFLPAEARRQSTNKRVHKQSKIKQFQQVAYIISDISHCRTLPPTTYF